MSPSSPQTAGSEIAGRLRSRRQELEPATLARISAVSPGKGIICGREYEDGLQAAVSAALDYAIGELERGGHDPPPVPDVMLAQARLAARYGVGLDTVLRRYLAGYTLLGEFVLQEVRRTATAAHGALEQLARRQARTLDRIVSAVSDEYRRESSTRPRTTEQRRIDLVEGLLAGEDLEAAELLYPLERATHLAVIILSSVGIESALRCVAAEFDYRLLWVKPGNGTTWGWLGARRATDPTTVQAMLSRVLPSDTPAALGEHCNGFPGWRLSHRQARATMPLLSAGPGRIRRYGEVALLAGIVHDDLLASWLHTVYLAPLEGGRDGGQLAIDTLRAYLAAGGNASSAAAALGVNRQTVANRLRAIEARIGRPPDAHLGEVEAALRLREYSLPKSDEKVEV